MAKLKITKTPSTDGQIRDAHVMPTTISSNYPGGTGGATGQTGQQIRPYVKIALAAGSSQAAATGSIIRQKGANQFLVFSSTAIQEESCTVGNQYRIATLDTTDWQQMGAPANATVGTIFVCTAACADPKNGVANLVGICTLANKASGSLAAGEMSITVTKYDSSTFYASRITNKWVYDYTTAIKKKYRYWLTTATTNNDYATDKAANTVGFVQVASA